MGNFDFGSFAKETSVSSNNYLRPYSVYENVKFAGIEGPTSGTSANGNDWTRYDFIFSCPDGTYKESVFAPNNPEKDTQRSKVTNANGHETELPSNFERTMEFLKYVGKTFNPAGLEKLQKVSGKIGSFAEFIEAFKKCIGTPDTTTTMKLGGRVNQGSVYAALPNYLAVNSKTGEVFIRDHVFGDKVALSAWELSKKKEYESAKPTDMSKKKNNINKESNSDDSQSVDSLLDEL